MTDYVITNGRSLAYPAKHYGAHFTGSRATFCMDADFAALDANVLAIPDLPIRVLSSSPVTVGEEFFGMHTKSRANDALPGITARTTRSISIDGGWDRWCNIEPNAPVGGVHRYIWPTLDQWVNTHHAAGRDLIFVLYGTPTWASARPADIGAYGVGEPGSVAEPADMANWSAFCTAVATRYLGKIKYYEVWNEVNSTGFFTGTKAKLSEIVRLANQAIKAVDPTAKIISPSIVGWSPLAGQAAETYFTQMMAAADGVGGTMKDWVDIVGVHLYLYDNRTWELPGIIDRINAGKTAEGISAKPTWDTESGLTSPYIVGLTDKAVHSILRRTMITIAAMGIERSVFYAYDNPIMGFNNRSIIAMHRESICNLLMSGKMLAVSGFKDGRVAYYSNAGLTII